MTNSQVAEIKRDDVVRDHSGRAWTATMDAQVSPIDSVDAWVMLVHVDPAPAAPGLTPSRRGHRLTKSSVEF